MIIDEVKQKVEKKRKEKIPKTQPQKHSNVMRKCYFCHGQNT